MSAGTERNRQYTMLVVILMAIEVLSALEVGMIYTALPTIVREFGGSKLVPWLVTGFLLCQAISSAVGARLGDIHGRKKIMLYAVLICGAGSAISAVSQSLEMIVVGRTLQGVSGAILPLGLGILREKLPPERLANGIGLVSAAMSISVAAGYFVAGFFIDAGHWRSIFWVTAGYAALVLLLFRFLPETTRDSASGRIDLFGGVLLAVAVMGMLLTLTGGTMFSPWIRLALLAGSIGVFAWWVVHEVNHPHPLFDVRLVARREFAFGTICNVLLGLGLMNVAILMMMILQQPAATGIGLGVSATYAALAKLPTNVAALIGSLWAGWIGTRRGSGWAVVQAGLVGTLAWTYLLIRHETLPDVILGTALATFSMSLLLGSLPALVMRPVPVGRSSEAVGMSSLARAVAQAGGSLAITALLISDFVVIPGDTARYPSPDAFAATFLYLLVTCVAIFTIGLVLVRRRVEVPVTQGAEVK